MSFNNILLDNITTPLDIILTSISPKVIQSNENVITPLPLKTISRI